MQTKGTTAQKTLALVTSSGTELEVLYRQLQTLLAEYAVVSGFIIDEDSTSAAELRAVDENGTFLGHGETLLQHTDLILFSSSFTAVKAACFAPLTIRSLIAARSLNTRHLDSLLQIPDRTEVILSGSSQESAELLLHLLREIGINFLHFTTYWPEAAYGGHAAIAVTTGDTILVPSCVKRVIDLGPYLIDITTLIEICRCLNLGEIDFQLMACRYARPFIEICRRLTNDTLSSTMQFPRGSAQASVSGRSWNTSIGGNTGYAANNSAPLAGQSHRATARNIYGIDFSKIDESLSRRGSLEEFISILNILSDVTATSNHATRDGIAKLISRTGRTLTVDQIRRRCDTLQQEGLLIKSRGRGGMRLTLKGKEYIVNKLSDVE